MSGLLRPTYRKEPGLTLDSRKCEAANPRLRGLTKFPPDQASDTDQYRCNGSERCLSHPGQLGWTCSRSCCGASVPLRAFSLGHMT